MARVKEEATDDEIVSYLVSGRLFAENRAAVKNWTVRYSCELTSARAENSASSPRQI